MKGFLMIIMELFGPPDGGPSTRFFMGHLIPGMIGLYSLTAIFIGKTVLPAKTLPTIGGVPGVCVACIYLGVAGLLHFHWGWGLSHERWHLSVRGKWAAFGFIVLSFIGLITFHP
ncbi:hypothetical protein WJU23_23125 [Prosthecobacter sp. SYSU 5D2]|uniref:hypothetical protein n=1 Tax=Prosthecobacter sp. SYSU 5D2 TaxID=3134134 RepID=UPI0031FF450E